MTECIKRWDQGVYIKDYINEENKKGINDRMNERGRCTGSHNSLASVGLRCGKTRVTLSLQHLGGVDGHLPPD